MPYGDPDRSVMDGLQHPQGPASVSCRARAQQVFPPPAVPVPHPAVWDPLLPAYLPALAYGDRNRGGFGAGRSHGFREHC